jgi:hypothetical protein
VDFFNDHQTTNMSKRHTDIQKLPQLLEKYVEMDTEEYRRAKHLIYERSKIQERIKKIMQKNDMTEFHTNTDKLDINIEFSIRVRDEIDEMIVPPEIKNLYLKQIEVWLENLIVKPISGSNSESETESEPEHHPVKKVKAKVVAKKPVKKVKKVEEDDED